MYFKAQNYFFVLCHKGQLIDKQHSESDPEDSYLSVIILYFVLRSVTAICLLKVDLRFKKPAKRVLKNSWQFLRKFEVIAFLVAFSCSGFVWGFLENFLFWLLEDLGSPKLLMGVSLAVGTLTVIPVDLFSSKNWKLQQQIRKTLCFYRKIMILSMFLYAIRLVGYSIITAPGNQP